MYKTGSTLVRDGLRSVHLFLEDGRLRGPQGTIYGKKQRGARHRLQRTTDELYPSRGSYGNDTKVAEAPVRATCCGMRGRAGRVWAYRARGSSTTQSERKDEGNEATI